MNTTAVTSPLSSLPAVGSTATQTPSSQLGEDQFMMLLTEQLKDQDPTQPVDNSQMIAQLAQFSELDAVQGLSSKMDTMVAATNSESQLAMTQLVGKSAVFNGNKLGLTAGTPSTFAVTLAGSTADTVAVIADANGNVVRTLHLGALPAGTTNASWDGLNDAGAALPSGQYLLSVSGTAQNGAAVQATANVTALITGVSYANGTAQFLAGGRTLSLTDIASISNPPAGP